MQSSLTDRRALWAFVLGCVLVTVGVLLHLPMFLMARDMGYQIAGMPMGGGMIAGMGLIVGGIGVAAYGLLPRQLTPPAPDIAIAAPEDAALGPAHYRLMAALVVALIIDVMKPASLGFTIPGMIAEYGVSRQTVSLVPFAALAGTVIGSLVWGALADIYGRKATILLSAVMFVGTSICGAMPSLAWNVGMCFLMGAAAGGMLPVTYALLAEMMPTRQRGWSLVLVGGLGTAGGYFAASWLSALLQPVFGWRILWLLNLPTGLLLVMLGRYIPESAKFLIARGRLAEARQAMARFGGRVVTAAPVPRQTKALSGWALAGKLAALTTAALTWGLVNFGLLLWLPVDLAAKGVAIGVSSRMLSQSALIAFPTVFLAALLYHRWSTKYALMAMIGVTLAGLAGVWRMEEGLGGSPVLALALLIVGSNAIIAILLPYAAESFALRIRGRVTGLVAASTKAGGLLAQTLGIMALVPRMAVVATAIMVPAALSMLLIATFGRETRGGDLRDLD